MNYNDIRISKKEIKIGDKLIGGNNRILIQSMTNTDSNDFDSTYKQIKELEQKGCDIVRMTVPSMDAVKTIYKLKSSDISIPIVADIHFDYNLAIESANAGIDKIRINPGNIGNEENVKKVVKVCNEKRIPIRLGINSGSLEKRILEKYGKPTAMALVESAEDNIKILEKNDFDNIAVSIKSSNVYTMIEANRLFSSKYCYPLHLGVTEAGLGNSALIKSSIGIGTLLCEGIGDTIRVSLTENPLNEIDAARNILKSIDLYDGKYINYISCPTCGRTQLDMINICNEIHEYLKDYIPKRKIDLAIMGCAVNGPGEASNADLGIACAKNDAVLFSKGKILCRVERNDICYKIKELLDKLD